MKDIYIDSQIANRFASPPDMDYEDLISWLIQSPDAYLVVSQKLKSEYFSGNIGCAKPKSISNIVALLKNSNPKRLVEISNQQIEEFMKENSKSFKKLRSNKKDHYHIPLICLSYRKVALIEDKNFIHDLINFPKYKNKIIAARHPKYLNYK